MTKETEWSKLSVSLLFLQMTQRTFINIVLIFDNFFISAALKLKIYLYTIRIYKT